MHIFPSNTSDGIIAEEVNFESIFVEVPRISTSEFINKWRRIAKANERIVSLGKLFSNQEKLIISRLLCNKISISSYKREDKILRLYFNVNTRDNIMILGELSLYISTEIFGKIKYKSENLIRQIEFENYLYNVLAQTNSSSSEGCR